MHNHNTIGEVVLSNGAGECPGYDKKEDMVEANGANNSCSIIVLHNLKMDQIKALLKKENSLKNNSHYPSSSSFEVLSNGNFSNNKHRDRSMEHIYVPRAYSYQTIADQRDHTSRCAYEEENTPLQEQGIQDAYESDAIYRFRMSAWSYRVVDFFGASRENVTIAFNYLDRFIDSGVYCW